MKQITLCFFLLAITLPRVAVEDVHTLLGRPLAVGNDRAIEGEQNPAYLVFQKDQSRFSFASEHSGLTLIEFSSSGSELTPSPAIIYEAKLGVIAHNLFGQRLSLAGGFSSAGDDASLNSDSDDRFRRTFTKINNTGSLNTTANVTSENSNSFSTSSLTQYYEGYVAAAYKIDRENSFGLSLLGGFGTQKFTTNVDIDWVTSSGATTLKMTESVNTDLLRGAAIIAYVYHTPGFDLGIRLKALTFDHESVAYDLDSTANSVSTTSARSYKNSFLRPPQINIGVSQMFFKFLRLYAEGQAIIPVNYTINSYTNKNGSEIQRQNEQKNKHELAFSLGAAWQLTTILTSYVGLKVIDGLVEQRHTDLESSTSTITLRDRQASSQVFYLEAGLTLFHNDPWLLYLGAEYFRAFNRITQASGGNGSKASDSTNTIRYSGIGINIGARYALK